MKERDNKNLVKTELTYLPRIPSEETEFKTILNCIQKPDYTRALLDLCGFGVISDQYKPCRPSQVILSENLDNSIMNGLINGYLNPFDESMDPNYLFNLSSGGPAPNNLATNIHNEGLMLAMKD